MRGTIPVQNPLPTIDVVERPVYQTSDSKEFSFLDTALDHQRRLNLTILMKRGGVCEDGEWSQEMVRDWILDNLPEIHQALLFKQEEKLRGEN